MATVDRDEYMSALREIREDIKELRREFRPAIDLSLAPLVTEVAALKDHVRAQNGRVTKLEQWRWTLLGGAAVVAWVISELVKRL